MKQIKTFIKEISRRYIGHEVSRQGAQLAYFCTLSMFPFIIIINVLIGLLDINRETVIQMLLPVLPYETVDMISSYVSYLNYNARYSVLSVGIVITIFSASKAMTALTHALNRAYKAPRRKGLVKNTCISMAMVVMLAITVLVTILFLLAGEKVMAFANIHVNAPGMLNFARWGIVLVILFFSITALYKFVPNAKISFRDVLPGTLFAMVGWMTFTLGFALYIKLFPNISVLYGSLGAIIMMMMWFYFTMIFLVLGAEINSHMQDRQNSFISAPKKAE